MGARSTRKIQGTGFGLILIDHISSRKSSDIPNNITPQEKTTSGREEKKVI